MKFLIRDSIWLGLVLIGALICARICEMDLAFLMPGLEDNDQDLVFWHDFKTGGLSAVSLPLMICIRMSAELFLCSGMLLSAKVRLFPELS